MNEGYELLEQDSKGRTGFYQLMSLGKIWVLVPRTAFNTTQFSGKINKILSFISDIRLDIWSIFHCFAII